MIEVEVEVQLEEEKEVVLEVDLFEIGQNQDDLIEEDVLSLRITLELLKENLQEIEIVQEIVIIQEREIEEEIDPIIKVVIEQEMKIYGQKRHLSAFIYRFADVQPIFALKKSKLHLSYGEVQTQTNCLKSHLNPCPIKKPWRE